MRLMTVLLYQQVLQERSWRRQDQSTGIVWSTNDTNIVPGINYDSTPALPSPVLPLPPPNYVGCNGSFDGTCNRSNLRLFFTAQGLPSNQYAAELCDAAINGYSDWYLPAMCELGYGRELCGSMNPTEQNVGSNILELYYGTALVNFANLAFSDIGVYWSSSTIEDPSTPGQYNPYYVYFYELLPPPGGMATLNQGNDQLQTTANYVRCVRKF